VEEWNLFDTHRALSENGAPFRHAEKRKLIKDNVVMALPNRVGFNSERATA
jgi:hypothetical protein